VPKQANQTTKSAKHPKRLSPPDADPIARIYAVVKCVPHGRVITYGQAAELAGIPRGHRIAARAMRGCPERLPWHRVLGKKDARRAQIAIAEPEHHELQRSLLEAEGVRFDRQGYVVLDEHGWLPREV
jgi:methylated-DNA-protein-cysteine methyltransferase-like protein